jgi:hypothetical protein
VRAGGHAAGDRGHGEFGDRHGVVEAGLAARPGLRARRRPTRLAPPPSHCRPWSLRCSSASPSGLRRSLAAGGAARVARRPSRCAVDPPSLSPLESTTQSNQAITINQSVAASNFSAAIYNAGASEANESKSNFFFYILRTASRTPAPSPRCLPRAPASARGPPALGGRSTAARPLAEG